MNIKLSKAEINSYLGDVLPISVISDAPLEADSVKWKIDGSSASYRSFEGDAELPFSDTVLVTLKSVGEARITATVEDISVSCNIKVRERKSSLGGFEFFRGDLHSHTTHLHNHEQFISRSEGFQSDMIEALRTDGILDFGVLSDHSSVMGGGYEFVRGFLAEEAARPTSPIIFPGAESAIMKIEPNRLGVDCRHGGEIVSINADNHVRAKEWGDFLDAYKTSAEPILIFAHPLTDSPIYGCADFQFEKICRYPELLRMIKCIEMGNGNPIKANVLHEYAYTRALDAGFRLTVSCGSDRHELHGFKRSPGRTVVIAKEKSREAIIDSLLNLRAYATESGNVKLKYTVNGFPAPCDLPLTNRYKFVVDIDYFDEDESTKITKCQVVSDKGEWVGVLDNITDNRFELEIQSDTARYFYLRLQDSLGRRTWSMPVWCSRQFDKYEPTSFNQIESKDFSATDLTTSADASATIRGELTAPYVSEKNSAEILIDMKSVYEISALGYSSPRIPRDASVVHTGCVANHLKFPRRIRISTSIDGKTYDTAYEGGMLRYSDEEIFTFKKREARFVKFDLLCTVADEYGRPEFSSLGAMVGLISLLCEK